MRQRAIIPEARPTSDVPYHHDRAPGQKYLVLDETVVPGSPVYVALRRVDHIPAVQPRWLDPHEHTCNTFYVFLGSGNGLGGLHAMVQMVDHTCRVGSPAAVLIPPRVLHHYWLLDGSGWYLQITLESSYVASLVPQEEHGSGRASLALDALVRPAQRLNGGWRLLAGDGVAVEVFESGSPLPELELAKTAACLDVVLAAEPLALLGVGGTPRHESRQDLVARIRPEAPFRGDVDTL
jgi:hypothetical protein